MDFDLLADLAQLRWAPPHLIQEVYKEENEEYEEALLPLDVPLMHQLPPIHGPEFALPMRNQVAGPTESVQSYVNKPEDSRYWPVEYEGMDYIGVQEDNEEEWNFLQQLVVEPEENFEDKITIDNKASQKGPIAVNFATKRPDPIANDNIILQDINPSAPRIATISLQEPLVPDATPVFGPSLVPVPHQQQVNPI